jgi:hypothetical protein
MVSGGSVWVCTRFSTWCQETWELLSVVTIPLFCGSRMGYSKLSVLGKYSLPGRRINCCATVTRVYQCGQIENPDQYGFMKRKYESDQMSFRYALQLWPDLLTKYNFTWTLIFIFWAVLMMNLKFNVVECKFLSLNLIFSSHSGKIQLGHFSKIQEFNCNKP